MARCSCQLGADERARCAAKLAEAMAGSGEAALMAALDALELCSDDIALHRSAATLASD